MVSNQQFRLKWNNHRNTVLQEFETLLHNNSFVDCTIGADGKYLKAHKMVLSACSPYLQNVFNEHFDKHPVILLKDVSFKELKCMIDYMYCGEVNISECELPSFLRTAQSLKIKGLAEDISDYDSSSDNEHAESNSFPTDTKRSAEANVESRDDEPPAKKSAPSLISANVNNSLTARKRKTPNSVPISGKPNTSSPCKTLAVSNSCKSAEIKSSNNACENESERTTNASATENCVNKSDRIENTIMRNATQNDSQEPRTKEVTEELRSRDVKEEPVDTDADIEDNSSYEYLNNPCDDSDQLNEDSESNCTNSGNKFADVSLANVSSYNENDANDENSGMMYFKEEVEVLPAEKGSVESRVEQEYGEERQEKFSFDTSDGASNVIVEYHPTAGREEITPMISTTSYPVLSQIIPTTLRKILPRKCTLSGQSKLESQVSVEKTISSLTKWKRTPRNSNETKKRDVRCVVQGYRKILPAPSRFIIAEKGTLLPGPKMTFEAKSASSSVLSDPLQDLPQSNSCSALTQFVDQTAGGENYSMNPIYLWNASSATRSGTVMLINSPGSESSSRSNVTASILTSPEVSKKSAEKDSTVVVEQVTNTFRKIAPRKCAKRK